MHMAEASEVEVPRAAATVLLLRDTAQGLEVLLQRRNSQMQNMAGMYVFPGGKLDAQDSAAPSLALLDRQAPALHADLGEPTLSPAMAAGLHIAALREALEECGLLRACGEAAKASSTAAAQARALLRQGLSFDRALAQLGLRLATAQVAPWSRWITPVVPAMATKRFDTRFFVAQAPAGQTAVHDNQEAMDSLWLAPRRALEQYRDGAIDMAPPQVMTLMQLARYTQSSAVLAAARSQLPRTIQPETFVQDGARMICYPGDTRHPVSAPVWAGPTRLRWQEGRFLPEEGFAALLTDGPARL